MVGVMSIEVPGAVALDYLPCRYGNSRLAFRGPRRRMERPYLAFLGGSETYGRFVSRPFPALVEQALGRDCVNLGVAHAGLDSFVNDPDVLGMAARAEVTVLQVPGAMNLSNRYYRVHPRRNDRFLTASPLLQAIYRDVDFTEFNFTRHMLGRLHTLSPERFETVRDELRQAWSGRMRLLLDAVRSGVVLLWLQHEQDAGAFGPEPLFVTPDMVEGLRDRVLDLVKIDLSDVGNPEDMEGMVYGHMELPAARQMPGPSSHDRIAKTLTEILHAIL